MIMNKYEKLLKSIEVEARMAANAAVSDVNFPFKSIGDKLGVRDPYLEHEIPFLFGRLDALEKSILGGCSYALFRIAKDLDYLEKLYIGVENIQHVRSQLKQSVSSNKCVGVHFGSIREVKVALNVQLKGQVSYYKPIIYHRGQITPARGEWHLIMSDKAGVHCKMFDLLDPFGIQLQILPVLAWAEYGKPNKFILTK